MHNFAIQPQTLREAWEQGLQQGLTQVALWNEVEIPNHNTANFIS
ncbi:hypothetical protein [Dendronalium phyllosphericum]|nr:hypothetical protein [Dendronalium phyllosphericum]